MMFDHSEKFKPTIEKEIKELEKRKQSIQIIDSDKLDLNDVD